ncbi:MAG: hypothetical protein KC438_09615, partial [Thermomicrobiales bacterium]|nr:hypothetical protein [Thermomicrobiales bacterium]
SIQEMERRPTLLLALPTDDPNRIDICLIVAGRIWSRVSAGRYEPIEEAHQRLERSFDRLKHATGPRVDAGTLDEAFILERWLNKHWGHPAMLTLPDRELPTPDRLQAWLNEAFETDFERWSPPSTEEDIVLDVQPGETRVPGSHDGWMPPHMIESEIQGFFG